MAIFFNGHEAGRLFYNGQEIESAWTGINGVPTQVFATSYHQTRLFISDYTKGVYESTDGGLNWFQILDSSVITQDITFNKETNTYYVLRGSYLYEYDSKSDFTSYKARHSFPGGTLVPSNIVWAGTGNRIVYISFGQQIRYTDDFFVTTYAASGLTSAHYDSRTLVYVNGLFYAYNSYVGHAISNDGVNWVEFSNTFDTYSAIAPTASYDKDYILISGNVGSSTSDARLMRIPVDVDLESPTYYIVGSGSYNYFGKISVSPRKWMGMGDYSYFYMGNPDGSSMSRLTNTGVTLCLYSLYSSKIDRHIVIPFGVTKMYLVDDQNYAKANWEVVSGYKPSTYSTLFLKEI